MEDNKKVFRAGVPDQPEQAAPSNTGAPPADDALMSRVDALLLGAAPRKPAAAPATGKEPSPPRPSLSTSGDPFDAFYHGGLDSVPTISAPSVYQPAGQPPAADTVVQSDTFYITPVVADPPQPASLDLSGDTGLQTGEIPLGDINARPAAPAAQPQTAVPAPSIEPEAATETSAVEPAQAAPETDAPAPDSQQVAGMDLSQMSSLLGEPIPKDDAQLPRKKGKAKTARKQRGGGKKVLIAVIATAAVLVALVVATFVLRALSFEFVTIYQGDRFAYFLVTKETDPQQIVARTGLDSHPNDRYEVSRDGLLTRVDILAAFPVIITADGETRTHYIYAETVSEAVQQAGYELAQHDELNLSHENAIDADDHIIIYRVAYETREVEGVIPWQEVDKPSPLVSEGNRVVMNPGGGQDGEGVYTQQDRYVDGIFVSTEVIDLRVTTYPRDVVTLVGSGDAILSPIDGADYTDIVIVDGVPQSYERVIESGVCTAYSFSPGTYGASGMYLFQGFVAVNTDVISYGSLLYITSPDGSFVYGWAIAADVGVAMMDGRVDVDCFFETYQESVLFGRHIMDIYVVAQLTQKELEQFVAVPGMFQARVPA